MTGNGAGTSGSTGATCCHIIYRRFDGHFMKKIGILFGQENSFPWAFIDRVNQKTGGKEIVAEAVRIDKVIQGEPCGYYVIIDRISQDVPFYRAFLKNAALTGTADRKSKRLNSSHTVISYAVFCLKKKKKNKYENL